VNPLIAAAKPMGRISRTGRISLTRDGLALAFDGKVSDEPLLERFSLSALEIGE
jgi:hypothetical protein